MKSYAYAMLAVIDNLGQVTFEYSINDEICDLTVTAEDATSFFGRDIKAAGEDVALLQKLMEKTGLTK